MNIAYLLLGSNEGNREQQLLNAKALLERNGCYMMAVSSIYETAAWGLEEQPAFLNQVVAIKTKLDPFELLELVQHIEKQGGRQREIKWGQRTLDIDMLLYNNDTISTPQLTVPHPFIPQRRFTLIPLAELAPHYMHPVLHKTIQQLLDECPDELEVKKI